MKCSDIYFGCSQIEEITPILFKSEKNYDSSNNLIQSSKLKISHLIKFIDFSK